MILRIPIPDVRFLLENIFVLNRMMRELLFVQFSMLVFDEQKSEAEFSVL